MHIDPTATLNLARQHQDRLRRDIRAVRRHEPRGEGT